MHGQAHVGEVEPGGETSIRRTTEVPGLPMNEGDNAKVALRVVSRARTRLAASSEEPSARWELVTKDCGANPREPVERVEKSTSERGWESNFGEDRGESGEPAREAGDALKSREQPYKRRGDRSKAHGTKGIPKVGECERRETCNPQERVEGGSRLIVLDSSESHEVSHQTTLKGAFPSPSGNRPTKKARLKRKKIQEKMSIASDRDNQGPNEAEGSTRTVALDQPPSSSMQAAAKGRGRSEDGVVLE